ncbi:Trp biosynthesis-associated membrane protein [Blastococcus deserti]|uniref:Trp biosynthesis-associated membrane protein n=1 Tax=Blastococcus deserti TaxID=2259033 RepID=A0ABW4XDR9_9ACTN
MNPSSRRELATAVAGAAAAGALALITGGQEWVEVTTPRRAPLPPVVEVLSGADAAPLVPATGLVLLAAAVALLAVRSAGRVVVGLLMAVAGGLLAWSGLRASTGGLGTGATGVTTDVTVVGPVLAVVAGVLGAATGALVVLRGRRWPGMGRRYERGPAAPAPAADRPEATDEDRAQSAWKALDRGEDPTA